MAKQETWVRLQDYLNEGYSLLRSLIDNGGSVCGIDRDRCRLLFGRLRDIREKKSIQIEFDDLPDDEKSVRARKMLEVLGQYHLGDVKVREYPTDEETDGMSEQEIDNYVKHVFDDIKDFSHKVWLLDAEEQRWERVFSGLIYEVETFVLRSYSAEDRADSGSSEPQQYTDELIDLFNGHVAYIAKLQGMRATDMIKQIIKWSKLTYADGKTVCKGDAQTDYGRELIRNGLIDIKDDNEEDAREKLRRRFSYYETEKKKKKRG